MADAAKRRLALGTGMLVLVAGCWDQNVEEQGTEVEDLYDPAALTVEGTVRIVGSAATDTKVTLHCNEQAFETKTDDDGECRLTADVSGCRRITTVFEKAGYQVNLRTVDLPLHRSPLRVDISLTELEEIQCGSLYCTTSRSQFEAGAIAQGRLGTESGVRSLEYIPGAYRDEDDSLLYLLGFGALDFRDAAGEPLMAFERRHLCFVIDQSALDWIGDMNPGTDDVELHYFQLDERTGRWKRSDEAATVRYVLGQAYALDETGKCAFLEDENGRRYNNWVPLSVSDIPDVRAKTHYEADPCSLKDPPRMMKIGIYGVCAPIHAAGTYAWGLTMPEKSCFNLQVDNQCGEPVSGVELLLSGVDHGYRTAGWTDGDGSVCVETLASEPSGKDFDGDGLGGELFWLDAKIDPLEGGTVRIYDLEAPAYTAGRGCAAPDECAQLSRIVNIYGACE